VKKLETPGLGHANAFVLKADYFIHMLFAVKAFESCLVQA